MPATPSTRAAAAVSSTRSARQRVEVGVGIVRALVAARRDEHVHLGAARRPSARACRPPRSPGRRDARRPRARAPGSSASSTSAGSAARRTRAIVRVDVVVVDVLVRDEPDRARVDRARRARRARRAARRSRPGSAASARAHDVRAHASRDRRCPASARPARRPARRARAWSSASRSTIVSSATMPAAAITPAWRIPPPSRRRCARASAITSAGPHSTEPTGAPSPFDRQNITVSAAATSSRRRCRRARSPRSRCARRRRARAGRRRAPSSHERSHLVGADRRARRRHVRVLEHEHRRRRQLVRACLRSRRRSRRARPTAGASARRCSCGAAAASYGTRAARSGHSTSVPGRDEHADRELVRHRARRHVERGFLAEQPGRERLAAG